MKRVIKKLVPESLRLWRYTVYEKARYFPELVFSLGSGIECPFCGGHFRRLRSGGLPYPILTENRVIGASPRPNVMCPRCKSHDRERLLYLFIKNETRLLQDGARVLHMAPEPQMSRVLRNRPNVEYISADLCATDAMIHADLLVLPFRDRWFDAVICNHVLEHVPDDRQGMREIHRVLKPDGWAILQVPIALALNQTIEDPSVQDEQERIRRFGQRDHVRMYSQNDYPARLRECGFEVSIRRYADQLGEQAIAHYALTAGEIVYFCAKEIRRPVPPSLEVAAR